MFKVLTEWPNGGSTSRVGEVKLVFADIVKAFGTPIESDGYKVSGEWLFFNEATDEFFTLYDWKMTSLYDEDCPSVEEMRANPNPQQFNIGGCGKGNAHEFKDLLIKHIEWVKTGKPFEQEVLQIASPIGLIAGGKGE